MDDDSASTFANRDEPIPVWRIPPSTDEDDSNASASGSEPPAGRRDRLKDRAIRVKDRLDGYISPEARQSLQDRLFASVISQIIPSEGPPQGYEDTQYETGKDRRSKKYVKRPEFGPRLMTNNFRRFNARIGVVFVLESRLIHLFSWRQPAATLSFLAVYSLMCLKPHLLSLLALAILLFAIMIPSFLARHPTPSNDPRIEASFRGPPTAPASRVKPAPDLSNDFWRNLRDLQNSMEDFSRLHDAANEYITPYTNFSNEPLSSTLFVLLSAISCMAFIGSQLVPWRFVALVAGWSATLSGHPWAQRVLLSTKNLSQLQQHIEIVLSTLRNWVAEDIVMDEPPEVRQVEIFELQKYHAYSDSWESWLFCTSPYDPLNPARMDGARPKGTQFFEDVQAPTGWMWKEKKWTLDLMSREWVEERMISLVEIETVAERWIYDLPPEEVVNVVDAPAKVKNQRAKSIPKSGWEEGTGHESHGEWRRRRWTRLVVRRPIGSADQP